MTPIKENSTKINMKYERYELQFSPEKGSWTHF